MPQLSQATRGSDGKRGECLSVYVLCLSGLIRIALPLVKRCKLDCEVLLVYDNHCMRLRTQREGLKSYWTGLHRPLGGMCDSQTSQTIEQSCT